MPDMQNTPPTPASLLLSEYVVLVDSQDNPLGQAEKFEAHEKGYFHRAFSVFLFDGEGRLLLQKRASNKYHSPDLWSNTCCGHPRPEEGLIHAALRRLKEEMGIEGVSLNAFGTLSYNLNLGELQENEYTHLLTGFYEGSVFPVVEEVQACEWVPLNQLMDELQENPSAYTRWFRLYAHKKLASEKVFQKALKVAQKNRACV